MADTVKFTQMKDGDQADYDLLARQERAFADGLPERIMANLAALEGSMGGYQISRLDHSLQSATRARRAGADVDWVVAALVHDIGDALAPYNHAELAADVLRPYVREEITWVIAKHGLFQTYYYGRFTGMDPLARDTHREHPWYQLCVDFCEEWDQSAFDPSYESDSLESFRADVTTVFSRREWQDSVTAAGPARLY